MKRLGELWEDLRPFAMRDFGDLYNLRKQLSGSSDDLFITLYSPTRGKVLTYTRDEDGLRAAVAAAGNEDVVLLPPGVLTLTQSISISHDIVIAGYPIGYWSDSAGLGTRLYCSSYVGLNLIDCGISSVVLDSLLIEYTGDYSLELAAVKFQAYLVMHNCFVKCRSYSSNGVALRGSRTGGIYGLTVKSSYLYGYSYETTVGGYGASITLSSSGKMLLQDSHFAGTSAGQRGAGIELIHYTGTADVLIHNCRMIGGVEGFSLSHTGGGG